MTPPPVGVDPALLRTATLAPGDPEAKCSVNGYYLARCLQARAHPEVPFLWDLYWDDLTYDGHGNTRTYSESEQSERRARVLTRLRADGATEILGGASPSSVWVIAPHPRIRGALALPDVQHATVSCAPDEREFCACEPLRGDQCPEHAFCQAVNGQLEDREARCMGPRTLAGCTRAEVCGDMGSYALDPEGRRWRFFSTCLPEQPGWRGMGYSMHLPPLPPDCAAP